MSTSSPRLLKATHDGRRAVVDDVGRAADLVDHDDVLALDEREVAHHLVAVGHRAAAVLAGVDGDDRLDRLVVVAFAAQVVAHDDGALVSLDGGILVALRADEEAHLAAGRNVLLAHVTQHLAVLDERGGADGALRRQNRKSHDGGDAVAAGGDGNQRILAQLEEGRLPQQVEGGGSAHGLFGKNHEVGFTLFGLLNRIDDFRGVALHIADGVVQLGNGYLHLRQF